MLGEIISVHNAKGYTDSGANIDLSSVLVRLPIGKRFVKTSREINSALREGQTVDVVLDGLKSYIREDVDVSSL